MHITPTLYLMLGLPGAGKTTTSEVLAELTGAVHISSDRFRLAMYEKPTFLMHEHDTLYNTLNYVTTLLLKRGISVIYDANLNRLEHRQEKYDLAQSLGVPVKLLWVQVPTELARSRAMTVEDTHLRPFGIMPGEMFERLSSVFEPPQDSESSLILDGTIISENYLKKRLS